MEEVLPAEAGCLSDNYSSIDSEGRLRADTYSILASLLSNSPSQDLIDYLEHINSSPKETTGSMGQAWQKVQLAAVHSNLKDLDDEYHRLFIGLGRGIMVPYGSWHLTGFLMDKPLSDLRDDLKSLGIESGQDQKDPEDHIAALCETMALIIDADDIDEIRQRQFFLRHINPWAEKFFKELQNTDTAEFYNSVGYLGQQFMLLEGQYLNIQTH